jgi:hypothetical protein
VDRGEPDLHALGFWLPNFARNIKSRPFGSAEEGSAQDDKAQGLEGEVQGLFGAPQKH